MRMKGDKLTLIVVASLLTVLPAMAQEQRDTPIEGPGAVIEYVGECEVDTFRQGSVLFANRNYVVKEAPDWLRGKSFLRSRINFQTLIVTRDGVLTILTPVPEKTVVPRRSQSRVLEQLGFTWVANPEQFQLLGAVNPMDQVRVYQKRVTAGEWFPLSEWTVAVGFESATRRNVKPWSENTGERLYNGIVLPEEWPPRTVDPTDRRSIPVPYLKHPPSVIPIDVGRQLFVDDFLIERTTLRQTFHVAEKYAENPVLRPETSLEVQSGNACTFNDGVFYDPKEHRFKMWYNLNYSFGEHNTALAYSKDGLTWTRPTFDVVEGTNIVILNDGNLKQRLTWSPWLDFNAADPNERFKAYLVTRRGDRFPGWLLTSPDGIRWTEKAHCNVMGIDGTFLFHNPFRKKWVFCVKRQLSIDEVSFDHLVRHRSYVEHDDFLGLAGMDSRGPAAYWFGATDADVPDPVIDRPTHIYDCSAGAYESIMLGVFPILYGPDNAICASGKFPKLTQIKLGFSRDGFHWSRGNHDVFIGATQKEGDTDRAYLRSAGGGCLVSGDRLLFYYCGFSGVTPGGKRHMYGGGTMHVAFLRRDGFASMDAGEEGGILTTRPVKFSGKRLFVNVDAPQGILRAEVLDKRGNAIEPFTLENCKPLKVDSTLEQITWQGGSDLSALKDKPVRFRFQLTNGSLYAFWVSRDETGRSDGYVAAGGPGYTSHVDTVGRAALEAEHTLPR